MGSLFSSEQCSGKMKEPWARLISLEGEQYTPVIENNFTIGRGKNSDLVISNNCFVSACHCSVIRDEQGDIWLKDTSHNGTLVDDRLVHNDKVTLVDGAVIRIVFNKKSPEANVSYKFNDLLHPLIEEDPRGLKDTIEYIPQDEEQIKELPNDTKTKVVEIEIKQSSLSVGLTNQMTTKESTVGMELTEHSTSPSNKIKSTKHLAGPAKKEESTQTSASPSYKMKSTKHLASPSALSSVSPAKTRNCIVQSNRRGQLKRKSSEEDTPSSKKCNCGRTENRTVEKEANPIQDMSNTIKDILICNICLDIMHDCVSLQPCLHNYCAGCYCTWMQFSVQCPTCCETVYGVSKNVTINNIVEAYLKVHPDKKRSDEELKDLDTKSKITEDMLFPNKITMSGVNVIHSSHSSEVYSDISNNEDEDGEYYSDDDEDEYSDEDEYYDDNEYSDDEYDDDEYYSDEDEDDDEYYDGGGYDGYWSYAGVHRAY